MNADVVLFGWNRSLPGRELMSAQHFKDFSEFLATQQREGRLDSFDAVLIEPHGGTFNGFFLLRGDPAKLSGLLASEEWSRHQARALMHLDSPCTLRGVGGARVNEQMAIWMSEIPKQ